MNTGKITQPLRALGLMHLFDKVKYVIQAQRNQGANATFVKDNPDVAIPPDYMLFEAFQLNYKKYYEGGRKTAIWLLNHIEKYKPLKKLSILDWGCGPARTIRHLPLLLGESCKVFGTDYNRETIQWCREHINQVEFNHNALDPPLVYQDGSFDVSYGISIFTHLSEEKHFSWFDELVRVSKKDGLILLTTHGDGYKRKLTNKEQSEFDAGQLVIRGKVIEGHRVFTAFHPPVYMRKLFGQKCAILKHIPGEKMDWGIEQDLWILQVK